MKNATILSTIILSISLLCSCGDNGSGEGAPEIISITPTMAPTGTTVTIEGGGFSATASENSVAFNGSSAEISSASSNQIEAVVPDQATSGAVEVVVNGLTAIGPNFTVDQQVPGITTIEPDSGTVGTQVTIIGMNFSPTPEENIVTFNGGVIAEVQQAGETELITKVPEGAQSGPIQVEVDGEKTLSLSFAVIPGTGALEMTASTTGQDLDSDGYLFTLDAGEIRTAKLNPNDVATFFNVEAGDHVLEMSGVTFNCLLNGANPRTVTVTGGETMTTNFDVECTDIGQIAFLSNNEIWTIGAVGSESINITNNPDNDDNLHWSPDGTQIAFQSNRTGNSEIWVMEADGSNLTNLTNDPGTDTAPRWSPDGTQIVFQSNRTGDSEIWVMEANGSNQTNLTNAPDTDVNPRWSPDGGQIAFISNRTGNIEIWKMDENGSNLTNLTNDPATDENHRWSPDGTQIVFESNRFTGVRDLWKMDADGSNQTNLTNHPETDFDARWSPDGTQIAFSSNRTGNIEIWVIEADGTNSTNLTINTGSDTQPRWSPDGTWIAFRSDRTGDDEIWVMRADGTNSTNLTDRPGVDTTPQWRPF